jgi:site-specific DNA-cytosine methylase
LRTSEPAEPENRFTFTDLFAGRGGMHISAEQNGDTSVFVCKRDSFADKTYLDKSREIKYKQISLNPARVTAPPSVASKLPNNK